MDRRRERSNSRMARSLSAEAMLEGRKMAKDSRGGERAEVKDSESAKASAGAGTDSGKGS